MAWVALTGFSAAAASSAVTMSAAAKGGEKKDGFLDWLNGAFEKGGFSETDPILNKVQDSAPKSVAPPPKKPAVKKAAPSPAPDAPSGGFLGGLFGKK